MPSKPCDQNGKKHFFSREKKNCKDEDPQNGPQISYPVSENCVSYHHPNQSKPTKVKFHLNLPFISFTPHFFCPFGTSLYNEFLRNQMQSKQMGLNQRTFNTIENFLLQVADTSCPALKVHLCSPLINEPLFILLSLNDHAP